MTLAEMLCDIGVHRWKLMIEWRDVKATFFGQPWPWPANVPVHGRICRRCGKRDMPPSMDEIKVEEEWGLRGTE